MRLLSIHVCQSGAFRQLPEIPTAQTRLTINLNPGRLAPRRLRL